MLFGCVGGSEVEFDTNYFILEAIAPFILQ